MNSNPVHQTDTPHPPGTPPDPSPQPSKGWVSILVTVAVLVVIIILVPLAFRWSADPHAGHAHEAAEAGLASWHTCGMHPNVLMPQPGICPICHMDLVPLDTAKLAGELVLDPRIVQSIGVRIAPAQSGPIGRTIRTVGTVDYDERAVRDVNLKVEGWIERLHVDFVGAPVIRGQPLFELYSPELYSAQQEYLLALRSGGQLAEAARTRLEFFDIDQEQIEALEQTGRPARTMTIVSPHSGVVIDRQAFEGMRVDAGTRAFRIADLSTVWVLAAVYEHQLPFLQMGQPAEINLPHLPQTRRQGEVVYIFPFVEPQTRQVRVRLEFDNADGFLKPGMFAEVRLQSMIEEEGLLVPREAILDTGERQIAFVSLGDGRFDPRNIRMGVEADGGMVQVLGGVAPGELVVTSGQFLLDSESRMREALAKMVMGDLAGEQRVQAERLGQTTLSTLPEPVARSLSSLLDAYMPVSEALVHDHVKGVRESGAQMARAAASLLASGLELDPAFWEGHRENVMQVESAARELAQAEAVREARLHLAALSEALRLVLHETGVPPDYPHELHEVRCPMFPKGGQNAYWFQPATPTENPYMGQRMVSCMDQRLSLPFTGE
jgi:multidrug efflux pump subunit AcrA (membrane-fusion protein)